MDLPWVDNSADERTTFEQFLDFFRAVVARKLIGLTREQAGSSPIPSTSLTIAGIVKHLAYVEDSWFQETFLGVPLPEPWLSAPFDADRDWDLHSAVDDEPAALIELYAAACERSRAVVAAIDSLDTLAPPQSNGEVFSMRWILVHMIDETARHAGHLDLLREAIDGAVGD